MDKVLRIAVLVETSTSWGTQVIQGISSYAHEEGHWVFFLEPRGRYEELRLPTGWNGDGIIARVTTPALAKEIVASRIPAVDVSWYGFGKKSIARCTTDESRPGVLAAEHFLERGFENFAYCGAPRQVGYVDQYGQSFCDALQAANHECSVFRPKRSARNPQTWTMQMSDLCEWLEELPKPVGLLAWSDVQGRQITEACHYVGIAVPLQVAVLGAENDELMGVVSSPPLSSIDMSARRVGYEAARMLATIMRGGKRRPKTIVIEPTGIITRQSTDTLAIDDPDLAASLRFIRDNAYRGIRVSDVINHVHVSRRILEKRFKQHLGRLPAEEIRRVRVERARRMLLETDLAMPQIATACGFNQPEVFTRTFRRETGLTPTSYRKQVRGKSH